MATTNPPMTDAELEQAQRKRDAAHDAVKALPIPLKDLLPGVTAKLASGTWIRLLGFDAARAKAQLDMVRRTDTCAVPGTCDARQPAVVAEPPAEVAGWLAALQAKRTADAAARRALVKGARVEFTNSGKIYVGTILRVSKLTAAVRSDDGNEWKCGLAALRPSTTPPPAALPPHPAMARWSLGKVKYGLVGNEGRSWEQPLLCDGKRIGYLRDDASGGSVDIDIDYKHPDRHQLMRAFITDADKWATAVGDPGLHEAYSSWAAWETDERPLGIAYVPLSVRFPSREQRALDKAKTMLEGAHDSLSVTDALKECAHAEGIPYGDEMAAFVKWANEQVGLATSGTDK